MSLYSLQDIHLNNTDFWNEFQHCWKSGNYTRALDILNNNEELITKYLSADWLNDLTTLVYQLETKPEWEKKQIKVSPTTPTLESGEVWFQFGGAEFTLEELEVFKYVAISHSVGDKFSRWDRYFTRTITAEPVIVMTGASNLVGEMYSGYVIISFSDSGVSGSYTEYGNITSCVEKQTSSGITYWYQSMSSRYPTSVDKGRVNLSTNTTHAQAILTVVPQENKLMMDLDNNELIGDQNLIKAFEKLIDLIYYSYYNNLS